jgi:hypothetical protein
VLLVLVLVVLVRFSAILVLLVLVVVAISIICVLFLLSAGFFRLMWMQVLVISCNVMLDVVSSKQFEVNACTDTGGIAHIGTVIRGLRCIVVYGCADYIDYIDAVWSRPVVGGA